jgi:hypothetical protein
MHLKRITRISSFCAFALTYASVSWTDEVLAIDEFRRTDAFAPTIGAVKGSFTSVVRLENGNLRAMGSSAGRFLVTDFLATGKIIGSASDARIEASIYDPFRSVAGADALALGKSNSFGCSVLAIDANRQQRYFTELPKPDFALRGGNGCGPLTRTSNGTAWALHTSNTLVKIDVAGAASVVELADSTLPFFYFEGLTAFHDRILRIGNIRGANNSEDVWVGAYTQAGALSASVSFPQQADSASLRLFVDANRIYATWTTNATANTDNVKIAVLDENLTLLAPVRTVGEIAYESSVIDHVMAQGQITLLYDDGDAAFYTDTDSRTVSFAEGTSLNALARSENGEIAFVSRRCSGGCVATLNRFTAQGLAISAQSLSENVVVRALLPEGSDWIAVGNSFNANAQSVPLLARITAATAQISWAQQPTYLLKERQTSAIETDSGTYVTSASEIFGAGQIGFVLPNGRLSWRIPMFGTLVAANADGAWVQTRTPTSATQLSFISRSGIVVSTTATDFFGALDAQSFKIVADGAWVLTHDAQNPRALRFKLSQSGQITEQLIIARLSPAVTLGLSGEIGEYFVKESDLLTRHATNGAELWRINSPASATALLDDAILLSGTTLAKVNRDGVISWQISQPRPAVPASLVATQTDQSERILVFRAASQLFVFRVNLSDGSLRSTESPISIHVGFPSVVYNAKKDRSGELILGTLGSCVGVMRFASDKPTKLSCIEEVQLDRSEYEFSFWVSAANQLFIAFTGRDPMRAGQVMIARVGADFVDGFE